MVSVTAISCPSLQYIFNTKDLLNNGMAGATNMLDSFDLTGFDQNFGLTRSQESLHPNALIAIKRINAGMAEIWRIEGDESDTKRVTFKPLFRLQL